MVDDEATNEQDDEGYNAKNLVPHLSVPSFSGSWALRLSALLLLVSYHRWFIREVNCSTLVAVSFKRNGHSFKKKGIIRG